MTNIRQIPRPGSELIRLAGDVVEFRVTVDPHMAGEAFLRTNIGHAAIRNQEIIRHVENGEPMLARDWRDIKMDRITNGEYCTRLPLTEINWFEAKTLFIPAGSKHVVWPDGGNVCIKVEPADTACANTVYSTFVRLFGQNKNKLSPSADTAAAVSRLDSEGYTVIAGSGTFRDLIKELDLIINKMRFRIIKLLPIHPAPTTYARMGRFGSPYAVLDFMDVDPIYAEFDRKTTPMEQFEELVDEIHRRNAKIHLDIPINHTGWGSALQIQHPGWYCRAKDREFESPGAWGVTWADLSRLEYRNIELWQYIADVFLFWCRKGVDGFRCDAGYMIPEEVWRYIAAKVRQEFPDTIFLLEGLGGGIQVTETLLTRANLDWSYSELFQNYDRGHLDSYLPHSFSRSRTKGLQIDFAETHDNNRLAARSPAYALMRTALCGLVSPSGGFGITCGTEWFADEKIDVHNATSLKWGSESNMTGFLPRLNALLETHPAFHHGAECRLIHTSSDNAIAVLRMAEATGSSLLCLINLNDGQESEVTWRTSEYSCGTGQYPIDLLSRHTIKLTEANGTSRLKLAPAQALCLSGNNAYLEMISRIIASQQISPERNSKQMLKAKAAQLHAVFHPQESNHGENSFDEAAKRLQTDPAGYCAELAGTDSDSYHTVITWEWPRDTRRVVMLPPGHILLVKCKHRFSISLSAHGSANIHDYALPDSNGAYFAVIAIPADLYTAGTAELSMSVYGDKETLHSKIPVLLLDSSADQKAIFHHDRKSIRNNKIKALCTNATGAMSLLHGEFGVITSQYNCLLGANLSPNFPVDRHIMLTRIRAWLVFTGYSVPLDINCTKAFSQLSNGSVKWIFEIPAGNGLLIPLELKLSLLEKRNAVEIAIMRGKTKLPNICPHDTDNAQLIIRLDIEDRGFHSKTKAYAGPDQHFPACTSADSNGFTFRPAADRTLRVSATEGTSYHQQPEWYYNIWHPDDAERGLDGHSDLFSPGYFAIKLSEGKESVITAAVNETIPAGPKKMAHHGRTELADMPIDEALQTAMNSYIVKRDDSLTIIAGYPWFLDWGRDTLICLRGIIQAGMLDEAREILRQFASFERDGTLPNMIRGKDDSNRDTSDASLWFIVACRDLAKALPNSNLLQMQCGSRRLGEIVHSIAKNYIHGTPNGIKMDGESGLIFSPSHYTWMDTNHPAGSPREGYPIEIQALWFASLEFLASQDKDPHWHRLAVKVQKSISRLYNQYDTGFLSDCLHCASGTAAAKASADDALRPNQLLAITLGAIDDPALRRSIIKSCEELLIPGAIRSLADRPVRFALPVYRDGRLLNDPYNPYYGEYTGDEDTRRKPAYHNGTGWTWLFPSYAEALFTVYGARAAQTAKAVLNSSFETLNSGCIGQIPELLDGNHPHRQKGCDAQAWGITELYRVLDIISTV